jgi:DNA-binding transcriptional regulator GbsR (MarR family)
MKIIRVSNELHAEFKKMCQLHKLTLNQGVEKLISQALKQGTFKEVPQSVFKKLKDIENLFRSWMRTQEKVHLDRINEDLLSLSRNLNDLGTKHDLHQAVQHSYSKIHEEIEANQKRLQRDNDKIIQSFKDLIEQRKAYENRTIKRVKKGALYVSGALSFLGMSLMIIGFLPSKEDRNLQHQLTRVKYEKLYGYCEKIEDTYEIEFLDNYDTWLDTSEVLIINKLKEDGYVHQGD